MEDKIFGTKLICPCGKKSFWTEEDFKGICAFVCNNCGKLHYFSEVQKKQVLDSMEFWDKKKAMGGD